MRIKLTDSSCASDLRAYFRRLSALAVINADSTLDVHLLKPLADLDDEQAEVRAYLRFWAESEGVPAELVE